MEQLLMSHICGLKTNKTYITSSLPTILRLWKLEDIREFDK